MYVFIKEQSPEANHTWSSKGSIHYEYLESYHKQNQSITKILQDDGWTPPIIDILTKVDAKVSNDIAAANDTTQFESGYPDEVLITEESEEEQLKEVELRSFFSKNEPFFDCFQLEKST